MKRRKKGAENHTTYFNKDTFITRPGRQKYRKLFLKRDDVIDRIYSGKEGIKDQRRYLLDPEKPKKKGREELAFLQVACTARISKEKAPKKKTKTHRGPGKRKSTICRNRESPERITQKWKERFVKSGFKKSKEGESREGIYVIG